MSLNISSKLITSGPNAGKWYVKDMDGVDFTFDTNTNLSYTDSSTSWYTNHVASTAPSGAAPSTLHSQCQTHEERHAAHIVEAETEMDGSSGKPHDMYDACEDAVADTESALQATVAGRLNSLIQWINVRSLDLDVEDHVDHQGDPNVHCDEWFPDCDYFRFSGCPGYHNCTPAGTCPGGC